MFVSSSFHIYRIFLYFLDHQILYLSHRNRIICANVTPPRRPVTAEIVECRCLARYPGPRGAGVTSAENIFISHHILLGHMAHVCRRGKRR